jgi:hypothetical protein
LFEDISYQRRASFTYLKNEQSIFVNIAELVGNADIEGLVTNEVGCGPLCNSQAQAHILDLLPTQKTLEVPVLPRKKERPLTRLPWDP